MKNIFRGLFLVLALSIGFTACSDDDNDTPVYGTTPEIASAGIYVGTWTKPTGQSLVDGASTAATSGCVVQFDVKKDGYLTVFGKLSSNKEYYVWEGDAVAAMPLAYTLAMDWSAAALADNPTIIYTVPADNDGYMNFADADIAKYLNGAKIYWPEQIVLGAASAVKKNGVGAIMFPVYAEAGTYLVHAAGSKISTCGAVFTTDPVTELKLTGTDADGNALSLSLIGGTTGIDGITTDNAVINENAPVYNLAGQRVSKNAKGILIQNGKKVIR
ncbi:hypothetical protein [Xylanibacter caecicola]|uniref:hypothetical protein n=1 Tax=Xylanibacter caecicola TaxID=2736294 RepID=UPI002586ABB1|nr:hypothetical protein [Xylanibacter caecicola]